MTSGCRGWYRKAGLEDKGRTESREGSANFQGELRRRNSKEVRTGALDSGGGT